MADLKVDYQLLTAIHRTLSVLAGEFENLDDQVSGYDQAFGAGGITAAMGGFAGNWFRHRTAMLAAMRSLDQMVTVTGHRFRQADHQLAAGMTKK